jgi:hypothetical protein
VPHRLLRFPSSCVSRRFVLASPARFTLAASILILG